MKDLIGFFLLMVVLSVAITLFDSVEDMKEHGLKSVILCIWEGGDECNPKETDEKDSEEP